MRSRRRRYVDGIGYLHYLTINLGLFALVAASVDHAWGAVADSNLILATCAMGVVLGRLAGHFVGRIRHVQHTAECSLALASDLLGVEAY